MNLSFAGCGFLGIYHVGVAVCFKKYAPHLLLDKISGASAGAIAACCLLCDLPIAQMTSNLLQLARNARERALGPFSPSFNVQEILLGNLEKYLPDDAHIRVSGKLHISLTRVYDGKNVIVSQYNSREDLLQALLASSFVPLFSGLLPPRFHGIRYMDGGFSDNLPTLDDNTVTVSPFCGESDICPRDVSSKLFHINFANTSIELSRQNMYRFTRILFPPNPEILSSMCQQGFDDALRYLQRNNLINCTRCLSVQSTFVVSEILDDNIGYDPECTECKMHRQEALVANLPETVMMIFQDAIDSANKGLVNWLFKHQSVKFLSLLSLPYTLPAEVIYATVSKILLNAKVQEGIAELARYFLEKLSVVFPKINLYYQTIPKTFNYYINITEYDSNIYDIDSTGSLSYKKQETNLNVTLQYNELQASNCLIDISNMDTATTHNAIENILNVAKDNETLMTYYYVNDNDQVQITEIYDSEKLDNEKCPPILFRDDSRKSEKNCWNEHTWISQNMEDNCSTYHKRSNFDSNLFDETEGYNRLLDNHEASDSRISKSGKNIF